MGVKFGTKYGGWFAVQNMTCAQSIPISLYRIKFCARKWTQNERSSKIYILFFLKGNEDGFFFFLGIMSWSNSRVALRKHIHGTHKLARHPETGKATFTKGMPLRKWMLDVFCEKKSILIPFKKVYKFWQSQAHSTSIFMEKI